MPLLSIIIPVYNLETYLADCLESILSQSFQDWEVILVNNASIDQSGIICDFYQANYTKIKVIHLPYNILPAGARNRGLEAARGEYVHFCDGDDYYLNNALIHFAETMYEKKISVLIGQFECNPEKGAFVTKDIFMDENRINGNRASGVASYLLTLPTLLCTPWRLIVKRDLLIEHNLIFREGYHSEDEEWVPKVICLAENFVLISKPFYCYRPRASGSITSEKTYLNTKSHLVIGLNLLKFYQKQSYPDSRSQLLVNRIGFLISLFSTRCDTLTSEQINELSDILQEYMTEDFSGAKGIHPFLDYVINNGIAQSIANYRRNVIDSTVDLAKGKEECDIYLMPTGYNGEATLRILKNAEYKIRGFFDNSEAKKGICINGVRVDMPNVIESFDDTERKKLFIIICNQQPKVISAIENQLRDMGIGSTQIEKKIY